jgi:hypothetical protein
MRSPLITPSRFPGDPLGYAGNQSGHAVMGLISSMWGIMCGLHWLWAAPVTALA